MTCYNWLVLSYHAGEAPQRFLMARQTHYNLCSARPLRIIYK
ncbi:hypothetical protein CIPAW_06G119000 [Carya illinoinensis]|uniref:Uncharacterized protein n=1 Tax=Carya illinoinensis TaxID=32201 RepID=A0A8T1QAK6_CARIL|nr:hypothetical protein CIPAW_06G119000 [Carya illinoinensis]